LRFLAGSFINSFASAGDQMSNLQPGFQKLVGQAVMETYLVRQGVNVSVIYDRPSGINYSGVTAKLLSSLGSMGVRWEQLNLTNDVKRIIFNKLFHLRRTNKDLLAANVFRRLESLKSLGVDCSSEPAMVRECLANAVTAIMPDLSPEHIQQTVELCAGICLPVPTTVVGAFELSGGAIADTVVVPSDLPTVAAAVVGVFESSDGAVSEAAAVPSIVSSEITAFQPVRLPSDADGPVQDVEPHPLAPLLLLPELDVAIAPTVGDVIDTAAVAVSVSEPLTMVAST
jgi:hypothetical protein